MAEQKIELRKIRDFSENLNDTFVFIRQNLKPLFISFLGISGIFMLASAIVSGIYQSEMGGVFTDILSGSRGGNRSTFPRIFSGTYLVVLLLTWANITAMKVSLIAYVKVYEQKQGEAPLIEEVWAEFRKYFSKVFFFTLPVIIAVAFGSLLCLVPGIYLAVVLVPFEMALIVEDKSFGGAWSRCFDIIKNNFWLSFAIYLVAYLIYLFSSGIIGGGMALVSGALSYFTTKDITTTIGFFTSILNIFTFLFFIVYYISAILNYFSLVEKTDGTGIMQRLNDLGGNSAYNNIEEQY